MKKSLLIVWGFIVAVLVLFFVISYFVKVPNTIHGEGILMNNDIVDYVSPKEGVVEYVHPDNMKVEKDQILWLFETMAQVEEIDTLYNKLQEVETMNYESFSKLFKKLTLIHANKLGSIALPYIEFYIQLKTYIHRHSDNPSFLELNIIENEIRTIEQTIDQDMHILANAKERLLLAKKNRQQDSILFAQRLITSEQWQNSKLNYLQAHSIYTDILKEIDIQKKRHNNFMQEMNKLQMTIGINENTLFDTTVGKYVQLIDFIKEWQRINVIRAPFNGTIKHYRFWNKNDFVQKNENLFVFTAKESAREIEVKINIEGAGKVKVGQKCLIELKEYPSKDYGMLQGHVKDLISLKHKDEDRNFSTYIRMQITEDGLTNYGHLMNTNYSMPVNAQIILDNERLFDKIFKRIEKDFKPTY